MHAEICVLSDVLSDISVVGRRLRPLHNIRLIYRGYLPAGQPEAAPGLPTARWFTAGEWPAPIAPFTAQVLASDPAARGSAGGR